MSPSLIFSPFTCNRVDVHPGVMDVGDFVVQESRPTALVVERLLALSERNIEF